MEWISAEESLPDEDQIVIGVIRLSSGKPFPYIAVRLPFMDQGDTIPHLEWSGVPTGQRLFNSVTHWMPLPELPKVSP